MHIAHVIHTYYPRVGGIERAVQCLAEEQVKLGHEVTVITSDVNVTGHPKDEVVNGVNVVRLRSRKMLYNDLMIPLEEPPIKSADIIHAHSQNSLFCLKVAQYAKVLSKPVVYQFIAVDYTKGDPRFAIRLFGHLYQEWVQRKAARLASMVTTLNYRDHELVKRKYSIESRIIPHGMDEKYLNKPIDEELFRKKFSIENDDIILYIGRLDPLKGVHVLIKSITILKNDLKNFKTVIVGGGPQRYENSLRELVKKLGITQHVIFTGYLDEKLKMPAIDASKFIVLPSIAHYESFPLIIHEAWARGKPVVVTAVGGLPYIVANSENGILVKPNDTKELAKALINLLTDENLRIKLGTKGKRSIKSWREITEMVREVYRDLKK